MGGRRERGCGGVGGDGFGGARGRLRQNAFRLLPWSVRLIQMIDSQRIDSYEKRVTPYRDTLARVTKYTQPTTLFSQGLAMNGAFSVSVLLPVSPIQSSLPKEESQQSHNGQTLSPMMLQWK